MRTGPRRARGTPRVRRAVGRRRRTRRTRPWRPGRPPAAGCAAIAGGGPGRTVPQHPVWAGCRRTANRSAPRPPAACRRQTRPGTAARRRPPWAEAAPAPFVAHRRRPRGAHRRRPVRAGPTTRPRRPTQRIDSISIHRFLASIPLSVRYAVAAIYARLHRQLLVLLVGAWLDPRKDKTVVAPARWFAGSFADPKLPFSALPYQRLPRHARYHSGGVDAGLARISHRRVGGARKS